MYQLKMTEMFQRKKNSFILAHFYWPASLSMEFKRRPGRNKTCSFLPFCATTGTYNKTRGQD